MYKDYAQRLAYNRQYNREEYDFRKSRGLCAECGTRDAYTISGRALCAECCEKRKNRKISEAERQHRKDYLRNRIEVFAAQRKCDGCGAQLKENDTHKRCPTCRAYFRKKSAEYRDKKGVLRRELFGDMEVCMRCGKPRTPGLKTKRGEPSKLCAACYEDAVSALRKGREAYREKHGIDFVRKARADTWTMIEAGRMRA